MQFLYFENQSHINPYLLVGIQISELMGSGAK